MSAYIVLALRILLILGLYAFIGWSIYTLWRDLNLQSQVLTSRRIPQINLKMEDESQPAAQQFEKVEVLIGRDSNCDYCITHETVSATHARLSYHHSHWWIEDLRSTNGTFLNDERVFTQTVLISGDELRIGKVVVLVTIG